MDNAPLFRRNVFDQIHEIVFHGQGGYDYATVYNMPIWLRKFTFNKLKEWYEKKNNPNKENNGDSWMTGEAKKEALQNKKIHPVNNMPLSFLKK